MTINHVDTIIAAMTSRSAHLSEIISVAIVEDDPVIRQHLSLIIDGTNGFVCKQSFPDAETALKELPASPPDVVLMDIGLPGMSGIECTRILKGSLEQTDIIMLTVQEDDESVFESVCAGATGYLLKETPPSKLLTSIQEVREGGSPMSTGIARKVVSSFRIKTDTELSDRETEVLQLLCNGENYKTISSSLFISGNTVRAHIKNIYKKLHVHSRAEAVQKAIRQKIV